MAQKQKQSTNNEELQNFLAGDKTVKTLERKELADLLDTLPDDHWLRPILLTEVQTRITG